MEDEYTPLLAPFSEDDVIDIIIMRIVHTKLISGEMDKFNAISLNIMFK
jgi:hypothetical protein